MYKAGRWEEEREPEVGEALNPLPRVTGPAVQLETLEWVSH